LFPSRFVAVAFVVATVVGFGVLQFGLQG